MKIKVWAGCALIYCTFNDVRAYLLYISDVRAYLLHISQGRGFLWTKMEQKPPLLFLEFRIRIFEREGGGVSARISVVLYPNCTFRYLCTNFREPFTNLPAPWKKQSFLTQ